MAGANRTSSQAVEFRARLKEKPYAFDFYQAMRLLEAANPQLPRLGTSPRASQDAIRLGQEPSMAFATSMIASFEAGNQDKTDRLDVLFFGLFGPNGPMPLHLTEYARDRERQHNDPTFRRFADVFHHRMLSLFYRAWTAARPTIHMDRPGEDRFFDYVGSLIGLGQPGARNHDELPDHSRLYLAGQLAMQNRPAIGLRSLVEEYLGVPVAIEEFIGEWLTLPANNRLLLGRSTASGTLGVTATAGERTWYRQGRFRIVCGPLEFVHFRRLLPTSDSLPRLTSLVREYIGDEMAWDMQLVLKAAEVPAMQLGVAGELGWTSWLGKRTQTTDADDVVVQSRAA